MSKAKVSVLKSAKKPRTISITVRVAAGVVGCDFAANAFPDADLDTARKLVNAAFDKHETGIRRQAASRRPGRGGSRQYDSTSGE